MAKCAVCGGQGSDFVVWIKAHVGLFQNKNSDFFAKWAAYALHHDPNLPPPQRLYLFSTLPLD